MFENKKIDYNNLPKHIGIIMDGNGRWAKRRAMPRRLGHLEGARTFDRIIQDLGDIGIKIVTFYAFSTENWKRPKEEVDALMDLLLDYLQNGMKKLEGKDTRVKIIGDITAFNPDMRAAIKNIENETKNNRSMLVQIALNYGGRYEIVNAAKQAAQMALSGKIAVKDIDEELLSSLMYNPQVPDPDLIIRPSGEYRMSNFLLWQSAYSELWFSNVLWPDFKKKDLINSILEYQNRQRRFGGI